MSTIKVMRSEQFHHENLTWLRLLEFFKQENIFLKNRLSAVVDEGGDKTFLEKAENFQTTFLLKDEYIDELKCDILVQDQDIKIKKPVPEGRLIGHQEKLRNRMEYFEKDFNQLKNEFNNYLSAAL